MSHGKKFCVCYVYAAAVMQFVIGGAIKKSHEEKSLFR